MDPIRALVDMHGFFTWGEAHDVGYDDRDVARFVRGKQWMRFRRGFYTLPDHWAALDDTGRHLLRAHAVLRSLGEGVVLSHVSAAIAHGISVWGLPLDLVHVTRLDGGAGRTEAGVVHHEGFTLDDDVTKLDGKPVTTPDRAALEAASLGDGEAALCTLDSVLHESLCTEPALHRRFELMAHWPGKRHLHVPLRMADGRAESVGESRGRWLCWSYHLPAPEPQFEVRDADGRLLGTCDWGWPRHGVLGEFDGRVKYGRLVAPDQEAGDVVFAEKQREDLLFEVTGYRMFRAVWSDYDRPRVTAARLSRLLGC
ncbi:hypothetical protein ACFP3Q_10575 [Nocardioides sp. GCM10027113]|uniref:hypothetical protein n=1 Tax=unclassified Nocardioides TaxID=2615069 RepID=UPI003618284E